MSGLSRYTFILCSLFLIASTFTTKRWNNPYNAVISWDAAGYYLYLPSFFYDDLGKIHKAGDIVNKYNPFGCSFEDANKKVNDNYIIKYTCGVALMELPAFIAAHYWSKAGNYPLDGFSYPYQICINFWSIFVVIAGLWFLRKNLLKWFDDNTVAIILFILCVATNLYNFTSFSGNMSHSYLFTLYLLIIYFVDKFYKQPAYLIALLLGLLAGLAVLTRPTEIVCMIPIVLWNVSNFVEVKERITFLKVHFLKLFVFFLSAIAVGSIQLVYWKTYSGHWIFWSYGDNETFSFLHPHIFNGLLSYKKGWFIYTPIMLLILPGFYFLYKKYRSIFWAVFLFCIVNIYFVFSWNCWWYGGSFSQRSLIQSYSLLAFPLAAFIESAQKKRFFIIGITVFILFCSWLNILMTYQSYCKQSIMETESMSKKYFWKIFGKTSIEKHDKKYIDLRDEIPSGFNNKFVPIYSNDFEQADFADSSSEAFSGKKVLLLNKLKQESKETIIDISNKQGYYRATVKVHSKDVEWNVWKQTQWIIALYNDNTEIRSNFYRIYRIIEPNSWQEISIDIKVPKNKTPNKLKIKFWNADSEKEIKIDDLKVFFAEI